MNQNISRALVALSFLFFVTLCYLYRPFVADDAYIVGRYALNAADGLGLVYNVGERVSALTSPLHALLLTALAFIADDPVALYRMLAWTFPLMALFLAFRIYQPDPGERAIIAVFGLASPFLALWTVGGLETPILTAVLTVFFAYVFKSARLGKTSNGDLIALGVVAALAFLARYDSVLLTVPLLVAIACLTWRRAMLWIAGAVSALIATAWLGFAYVYYGDVLPTSAYVKLGGGRTVAMSRVVLLNAVLVTGAALAFVFWLVQPKAQKDRVGAIWRGGMISGGLFLFYAFQTSGAHMMFGYRMFVPVLIPLAMVLAASIRRGSAIFLGLQAVLQGGVAVVVLTHGMNVQPVSDFGRFGTVVMENRDATPRAYGGFMTALENSAKDLQDHWAAQDNPKTPRIFLYTGGTGYWLRNFYVYETLVGYRKACAVDVSKVLAASDYVQDLDVYINERLQRVYRESFAGTPEYERLFTHEFFMYRPWTLAYNFATPRSDYDLSKRLNDPCA